jgi:branched-chain amino acid transport system permease protein
MALATQTNGGAPSVVMSALRDAAAAAIITFFLCFPIIMLHAEADNHGVLFVSWRPWAVLIICALAFVGRLAVLLWSAGRSERRAVATVAAAPSPAIAYLSRYVGIFGAAVLFVFPLAMVYLLGGAGALKWVDSYGVQILIYVMLGWGLNIVVGLAGLLDLGYVAFYAVGAYTYALLATTFGLSFWLCLPVAGMLAAIWGMILGFPVLRLRGDYLAIVTLAFGEIIRLVLINWVKFSGGYAGITSIPRVSFFGLPFKDQPGGFADFFHIEHSSIYGKVFLYYIILCLAFLTNFVTMRLRRLPIGRAWEALREDEIACRALGINTVNTKLTAFALGAFFAGLAGSFFAVRQGFISPESFTFLESAQILAIVVLGGMGSQLGVALAAVVLVGGFELLRELDFMRQLMLNVFGIPNFDPAQYRGVLFGLAMVLMMIFRPRGFVSSRTPSIFLKAKKAISGDLVGEGHG